MGDHMYIPEEESTRFVVLVDMIPEGGLLRAFTSDGDFYTKTDVPPSLSPFRVVLSAPKYVTSLQLSTPDGSSVTTQLDHREPLGTLYIFSCDLLEADTNRSLWGVLLSDMNSATQEAVDGRSVVLHVGDNVYADMCWNAEVRRREREDMVRDYTEIYRARYRSTWFGTDDRAMVYATASHLMLLDDHEVTNNFMDRGIGKDKTKELDCVRHEAAMQAYTEYQEALLYPNLNRTTDRGWVRLIGNDLIITIDRAMGKLEMNKVISMIGPIVEHHRQNAILSEYDMYVERENGHHTTMLSILGVIVVFSTSMIPYPRGSNAARRYTRMYGRDKFTRDDELKILYRYLFSLTASGLDVLLVGGDLHFGMYATVTDETGFFSFDVVVASPISNHPTLDRRMMSRGFRGHDFRLESGIVFVTHSTQGKRCYAKVSIRENGHRRYSIQMVYSTCRKPASYWNYYRTLLSMA